MASWASVAFLVRAMAPSADRGFALHQGALDLAAADPLVQHKQVVRVDNVLGAAAAALNSAAKSCIGWFSAI
jgi:hypothetical protein